MSKEKQIESTDWLTRGMSKEEVEREKQQAIMSVDLEMCHTEDAKDHFLILEEGDSLEDLCTPKEENPKVTCVNCKHLMFSDFYGECNKRLKIVNPSDTCEFAEPKERGGVREQM